MNSKLFVGALVLVAAAGAACKKTAVVSTGGTGGTGSTTSVTSSNTTSKATTGTATTKAHSVTSTSATAVATCTNPTTDADCASCTDNATCSTCWSTTHQAGVMAFNTAIGCLECTSLATRLPQATATDCPNGPPATKDPCDMGTPGDSSAIQACAMCGQMGTCKTQVAACTGNPDCVAIDNGLQMCPQN